jgi:formylglycine-generating enzyme required for sulfatase activity
MVYCPRFLSKQMLMPKAVLSLFLCLCVTLVSSAVAEDERAAPRSISAESMSRLMDEMIWVKGGSYSMGSDSEKASSAEKPAHKVKLDGFHMGKFEVSQDLFQEVMGWDTSYFPGEGHPVNNVSWINIQRFIERLNRITGKHFRLPTEAEWEYAAKGGQLSKGYQYSGSDAIGEVAWYAGNGKRRVHPSGKKKPNELGLYDMTGNLWEFCHDEADMRPYPEKARINPVVGSFEKPYTDAPKITRGGGYEFDGDECLVYRRDGATPNVRMPDIGFRLVMIGKSNPNSKPRSSSSRSI